MKKIIFALLAAFALSACGSSDDAADEAAAPTPGTPIRPSEYFVWADPGIASGNLEADYADCTAQIEKDPAITDQTPELARVSAYIQCMTPKGWKFVDPNATAQP